MSASKAQIKANMKWNKKVYDTITLRIKKGSKQSISEHASTRGESLNAFIIRAIETQLLLDQQETSIESCNTPIESYNTPIESSVKETPSE